MTEPTKDYAFPEHFYWGCSTSAHQIEGGLRNDWSEWEQSPNRLETLKRNNHNPQDFISNLAANSYLDNNADIACMKELGLNSYRFSVDWSRIEPEEGVFNEAALEYYRDFVKKLRGSNIEPFVTLWHWPIPLWMKDKGGWASPDIVKYFTRFTEKVVRHLSPDVRFWVTLNEPMVYSSMSYLTGTWPPQKKNPFLFFRVVRHLIAAHRSTYTAIKSIDPAHQVGIAKHNIYFEAHKNRWFNCALKSLADWLWNELFLNKIADKQDFIGLNYYFHNKIDYWFGKKHAYDKHSDIGWGLHPEGMYYLLKDLKKYNKPVYITENGLADRGDQHRSWYIREVLKSVHRAIEEGMDVRGYFHWSLIDNFEWALGYHPRFGLYEVNYQTFERIARPSAQYYADICRKNRVV